MEGYKEEPCHTDNLEKGFELLGCNSKELLVAARDNYSEDIDVLKRGTKYGNEQENSGMISALFDESVFHNHGALEEDGLSNDDIYVEFGDDAPEGKDGGLNKRTD